MPTAVMSLSRIAGIMMAAAPRAAMQMMMMTASLTAAMMPVKRERTRTAAQRIASQNLFAGTRSAKKERILTIVMMIVGSMFD